jgi:hypothetical protein
MMGDQFELIVTGIADSHDDDLDDASRNLRDDLLEIEGVEVTEATRGPAPAGTRSAAELVLATIVVAYYAYRNARYTVDLARVLRQWLDRNKGKRTTLRYPDGTEVDLTNLSEPAMREAIEQVERGTKTDVG